MSSGQRCQWSQASPLGSWQGEAGSCSHIHQSLFQLPPSTWWAEVAVPQTKPSGKRRVAMRGEASGGGAGWQVTRQIRVMLGSSRFQAVPGYPDFSQPATRGPPPGPPGSMPQIFYPSTNTISRVSIAAAVL